jgi:hypothetical protein
MRELPKTNGKHHEPYSQSKEVNAVVTRYDPSWERPYEMDESRIGKYVLYSDYRDLEEHFHESLNEMNLVGVSEHKDFPKPLADLQGGPVFHYKTIEQWLIKRGFTKGDTQ